MSDLNQIFKAYIQTKNKVPTRRYTDPENQYTLEQISGMPEYAGLLAEDAVLVDIDDPTEAELLLRIIEEEKLKCRVHRSTRGIHAFFLGHHMPSTKNRKVSGLGIIVDWKLGSRNGIAVLKMAGKEREVLHDSEELQELPPWLYPVKDAPLWAQMAEGDGRNDELYNYILTLQSAGLTKEESREVIRIINTYVLKEPLSESEISTITRDEAFPSESFYNEKGSSRYADSRNISVGKSMLASWTDISISTRTEYTSQARMQSVVGCWTSFPTSRLRRGTKSSIAPRIGFRHSRRGLPPISWFSRTEPITYLRARWGHMTPPISSPT